MNDDVSSFAPNRPICPIRPTRDSLFLRGAFLYLAAVFVCTPFVLDPHLHRPAISQWFFYQTTAFLGALLFSLARMFALKSAVPPTDPLRPWIALYVLSLAAAAALSHERLRSFWAMLIPLAGIAFYTIAFAYPWNRDAVGRFVDLLSVGGYLAAAYAIVQACGGEILPYSQTVFWGHLNVVSVFGHPNFMSSYFGPIIVLLASAFLWDDESARPKSIAAALAGILAAGAFCAAYAIWRKSGLLGMAGAALIGGAAWGAGWFRVLSLVALAVSVALAGSRGVWLGLVAAGVGAGIALVIILRWRPRHGARMVWSAAALATIAIAAAALTPIGDYFSRRLLASLSVSARLYQYTVAAEMVKARPWFGWGGGAYATGDFYHAAAGFLQKPENRPFDEVAMLSQGTPPGHVHNDLLETAVDCGILGVFAALGLAVSFLSTMLRGVRSAANSRQGPPLLGLLAAVACVAVDAMTGFPLGAPCSAMLFWGLLGIGSRLAAESAICGNSGTQSSVGR